MAIENRIKIIYTKRIEENNTKYPTLNILVSAPIPDGWVEYPTDLISANTGSNNSKTTDSSKNDINTYKYDSDSKTWVDDIDFIKKLQKSKIDNDRYIAEREGFTYGNFFIKTDDVSQAKITGASVAALADSTYALDWKMGDGTFVKLDAKTIMAVSKAVLSFVEGCFTKQMLYYNYIDTLTTREDIEKVVWGSEIPSTASVKA